VSTDGLKPVGRESTTSIIARRLRAAIADGSLPQGGQLGEAELARRFDVSRGTLREAMQRLVEEDLLRSERHRGLFVRELSADDVYDVYLTRNAIEQTAARLILRGDRNAVADTLDGICREMQAAVGRGDGPALSRADARYHEVLVTSSGSRHLSRMSRTLLIETHMCIHALTDPAAGRPDGAEDRVGEHDAITAAIRAGNEALVLGLIDAHMEDAVRRLAPGRSLHAPLAPAAP
jgi:DNA-binding GntR family transcriptional regulator